MLCLRRMAVHIPELANADFSAIKTCNSCLQGGAKSLPVGEQRRRPDPYRKPPTGIELGAGTGWGALRETLGRHLFACVAGDASAQARPASTPGAGGLPLRRQ